MKSDSGSEPHPRKYRLHRTLRRGVKYRPIEDDDTKYAYAAYKTGNLSLPGLDSDHPLGPKEFGPAFTTTIVQHCHVAWTVLGTTRRGFIPIGLILAAWAPNAPFLIISTGIWLPWASKRNIIEGTVGFLNGVRREYQLMIFALHEHNKIYKVCMRHGIIRQIGTSHVAIPGKSTSVYETRAPKVRA